MDPIFTQQFNMPAPKGGMFAGDTGKFGIGQAIVAALNGYLASQPGGAGEVGRNNMQMMADMRQKALEHQQSLEDYNRKRADDRSDFTFEQNYKAANPVPGEQERMLSLYTSLADDDPRKSILGSMLQHPVAMDVTGADGSVTRQYVYPGTIPQQSAPPKVFKTLPPGAVPINDGGPAPQAPGMFP